MADIRLVPQVYNARRTGVDLAVYPRITAIMAHLETVAVIAAAHADVHLPRLPYLLAG